MMTERAATVDRKTSETQIRLHFDVDGSGESAIDTGIGAFDHFLTLFARHGLFDLEVAANGDLNVDGHHTTEDVAICLGQAILQALGDHRGIRRTASLAVPMDEALAHIAIDLSGRSHFVLNGRFSSPLVGELETDLVRHFFDTLSREARMNIHVITLYGQNSHHEVEAIFKAFARALDAASQFDPRLGDQLPSTKDRIEGTA
ncbi:imidazoleglycerol-phosphate dehydratase HisB [soil metagenome]